MEDADMDLRRNPFYRPNPVEGDDLTFSKDMLDRARKAFKDGAPALVDYARMASKDSEDYYKDAFIDMMNRAKPRKGQPWPGRFNSDKQKAFWRGLLFRMERYVSRGQGGPATGPTQFVPPTSINLPSKFTEGSPDYLSPSDYQLAIRDAYLKTDKHILVDAKAGSGKTTTIEWLMSTTYNPRLRVLILAFNVAIKKELAERIRQIGLRGVKVSTLNGLGHGIISRAYPKVGSTAPKKGDEKTRILAQQSGIGPGGRGFPYKRADIRGLGLSREQIKRNKLMVKLLGEIIAKIKSTLTTPEEYEALIQQYKIGVHELEDADRQILMDTIPELLIRGIEVVDETGLIDFNDQIFMSIVGQYQQETGQKVLPEDALVSLKRTRIPRSDVTLVDETQDLNRAQQRLALATTSESGGRMICVGDPFQSIMGFAGADSRSMENLFILLSNTPRGCVTMPLSTSWRCPKSVIEEAQGVLEQVIAPDQPTIVAAPHAPAGIVETVPYPKAMAALTISDSIKAGDTQRVMILCRRNAPLFNAALRLIARGIPASIKGREIAKKIMGIIEEISPKNNNSIPVLLRSLGQRLEKLTKMEQESGTIYDTERDTIATIQVLASAPDINSVDDIERKLKVLFADKENAIMLSSIHKSKGLEAAHILILEPERLGQSRLDSTEDEARQEVHMHYVAVTRTKFMKGEPESGILTYVIGDPSDETVEIDPEFDPGVKEEDIIETEVVPVPEPEPEPGPSEPKFQRVEELQEISLPTKPKTASSEPTMSKWEEIRDLYTTLGIPAKITKFPRRAWTQYVLLINGVAIASTTLGYESKTSEPKKKLRVLTFNQFGSPAINTGIVIPRSEGWENQVLEKLNEILRSKAPTDIDINRFENLPTFGSPRRNPGYQYNPNYWYD